MTTKADLELPSAAELQRIIGTRRLVSRSIADGFPRLNELDPAPALRVGDVAWAWAFGRLRRGRVVKVARVKVSVAYVSPSNPDEVRVAHVRAGWCYPDRRAAESGAA